MSCVGVVLTDTDKHGDGRGGIVGTHTGGLRFLRLLRRTIPLFFTAPPISIPSSFSCHAALPIRTFILPRTSLPPHLYSSPHLIAPAPLSFPAPYCSRTFIHCQTIRFTSRHPFIHPSFFRPSILSLPPLCPSFRYSTPSILLSPLSHLL